MNRIRQPLEEIDIVGKLADLKEQHYQNLLILTALLEVLIDKGVITTDELRAKTSELESFTPTPSPYPMA